MKHYLFIALLWLPSGVYLQADLCSPVVDQEKAMEAQDGLLVGEAEHFYKQSQKTIRAWYRTSKNAIPEVSHDPDEAHFRGAGNDTYLEVLPDTRTGHEDPLVHGENFSNEPGKMGVLHYRIRINNPGKYYVWVRAYSTGTEDNGLHVGYNGKWPDSGRRLQWCEGKNTWRWESKQRTEAVHCGEPHLIFLEFTEAGIYDLQFSMREDGFEFDQFLLTTDRAFTPEDRAY